MSLPLKSNDISNMVGLPITSRLDLCREHARRWMDRSAALSGHGQHTEAEDADEESASLWDLYDALNDDSCRA